ncbi:hypothetical protein BKA93DRAFT_571904 [Sparassis latifolia]
MATYIGQPKISAKSRIHRLAGNVSDTKSKKGGLRNRGKVTRLRDIPLDIFFKSNSSRSITLGLCIKGAPPDMSLKAIPAFVNRCHRNVPGLPACPPRFISEPRYAAVVYDRFCLACGIGRAGGVEYGIAMRFCGACHKTNLIKGRELVRSEKVPQDLQKIIFTLLPRVAYNRWEYLWSNRSGLKNVEGASIMCPSSRQS